MYSRRLALAGTTTDTDLMNALQKEGITLADSDFNKTLMDLEIYGLVRVSWLTKDKRRIELVADPNTAYLIEDKKKRKRRHQWIVEKGIKC